MTTYRVEVYFYLEAEGFDAAELIFEDGISSTLAADYELVGVFEEYD